MVQFDTLIELPEDEDIIWRYLSFSRFVAMLENGGVFFPRAHLFEDQWEGSLSSQNLEVRRESLAEAGVDESRVNSLLGTSTGFNEWNRQWMLVSCWHLDDVESDAMWRLYGSGEGRLALRSSVGRLRGVLPDDIQVGRVNYIDYATDAIPQGNILFPYSTSARRSSTSMSSALSGGTRADLPRWATWTCRSGPRMQESG